MCVSVCVSGMCVCVSLCVSVWYVCGCVRVVCVCVCACVCVCSLPLVREIAGPVVTPGRVSAEAIVS